MKISHLKSFRENNPLLFEDSVISPQINTRYLIFLIKCFFENQKLP
ncbi:hypothetical protein C8N25_11063 [Algoriphagus antarcticus]|uniref:Uncharacterized protein n=1 Tax=Algoriphagus antarcticus TaxID=238540 RepID=A0A3E0DUW2_9BACT|nr:hypothetical protein C8N25_11063 [Algoriphagus antarcticus]